MVAPARALVPVPVPEHFGNATGPLTEIDEVTGSLEFIPFSTLLELCGLEAGLVFLFICILHLYTSMVQRVYTDERLTRRVQCVQDFQACGVMPMLSQCDTSSHVPPFSMILIRMLPPSWPHYGGYGEREELRGRTEDFGRLKFTPAMSEDYVLYCVQKTGRPLALHFTDLSPFELGCNGKVGT